MVVVVIGGLLTLSAAQQLLKDVRERARAGTYRSKTAFMLRASFVYSASSVSQNPPYGWAKCPGLKPV